MLQAYLSAGSMNQAVLQVKDRSSFHSVLSSIDIQDAVTRFGFTETNTKGTLYKRGKFLVTGSMDNIEFSELALILINNDTGHFLVPVYSAEFLP